jgi:hypothetical protein
MLSGMSADRVSLIHHATLTQRFEQLRVKIHPTAIRNATFTFV